VLNTEGGPAGLDFPEFTNTFKAGAAYANKELGGIGGRPIELVTCAAKGTPESSQACAQQLTNAKVQLVMVGLEVFADYTTYAAANVPLVGIVPVLPGDYVAAGARYLSGGNLVVMTTIARYLSDPTYLGVKSASVVMSDTAASNSALGILQGALDKAGVKLTVVKGADNATEAEYQNLMREANDAKPEAIISLYPDAGCIGTMKARKTLGITVPAFTTGLCSSREVLDAVGDAADGWIFAGVGDGATSATADIQKKYTAQVTGESIDKVDIGGFAGLGWLEFMTVLDAATSSGATGDALTGQVIFDRFGAKPPIVLFGSKQELLCGQLATYPALCGFALPFAEAGADGVLTPLANGGLIDGTPLLP
jgi:branched-chain amino acid transport system substrate-binding protein